MGVRDQARAKGRKFSPAKRRSLTRGKASSAAHPSYALVKEGDTAPKLTVDAVQNFLVEEATRGKQEAAIAAIEAIRHGPPELAPNSEPIRAILAGAAPDDAERLRSVLEAPGAETGTGGPPAPDASEPEVPRRDRTQRKTSDELADDWRRGYPYKFKMLRRDYEEQKFVLQTELLKLQAWVEGHAATARHPVRGPRCGRQGRRDQALHGASQSARRARGGA